MSPAVEGLADQGRRRGQGQIDGLLADGRAGLVGLETHLALEPLALGLELGLGLRDDLFRGLLPALAGVGHDLLRLPLRVLQGLPVGLGQLGGGLLDRGSLLEAVVDPRLAGFEPGDDGTDGELLQHDHDGNEDAERP